jgi:ribosomal protein S18 acetylase RimI-like enzyme
MNFRPTLALTHSVERMRDVTIENFRPGQAEAVSALCRAEGWESWDDPQTVARALTAPGVMTLVALRGEQVVGAIEVLSDGDINWVIGTLVVAASERSQGIGTMLVSEAFWRTKARRLDLLTEEEGPHFYERLPGRPMVGFRLYPS